MLETLDFFGSHYMYNRDRAMDRTQRYLHAIDTRKAPLLSLGNVGTCTFFDLPHAIILDNQVKWPYKWVDLFMILNLDHDQVDPFLDF